MSRRHQRVSVRPALVPRSQHIVLRKWTEKEREAIRRFCQENAEAIAQADGLSLDACLEDLENLE